MKMRSMELTKKEAGGSIECAPSFKDSGPRYPFGLELRLDDAALKKLGIDVLPKVGAYFKVRAEACVTSVSSSEHTKGSPNRTVCLQIERLAVDDEPETMEEAVAKGVREA